MILQDGEHNACGCVTNNRHTSGKVHIFITYNKYVLFYNQRQDTADSLCKLSLRWRRRRGRRWGKVRKGGRVWQPERRGERRIEERWRRRGVEREVRGWKMVRRWRVRTGSREEHRGEICVSWWWLCVSEWSWVLVVERRPCMSWWEAPPIMLMLLLRRVLSRFVWKRGGEQENVFKDGWYHLLLVTL